MKKVFLCFSILLTSVFVLTGCGQKCYICERSGATKQYLGYYLCDDCYSDIITAQYEQEYNKEKTESEVKSNLKINLSSVYHEGDYIYVEGSLTNNSEKTVKYVKVKLSYLDKNGNVVDTDDTYACGSEGLAPGESTKFDAMQKDTGKEFKSVSVSIYDFDIAN